MLIFFASSLQQGKTLSLKLKTVDFLVRTRSQTLSHYTNALAIISAAVAGILKVEIQAHSTKPLLLRLMGECLPMDVC